MHKAVSAAMQSLLQAVGVGAKNSLPAAAGINWVLKDGLGRLGRLSVSTRFGTSFDSNLKVLLVTSHYLVVPCTPSIPTSGCFLALATTLWSLANACRRSLVVILLWYYRAALAWNSYLHA